MDLRHVPCHRALRSAGASTFHLLTAMTQETYTLEIEAIPRASQAPALQQTGALAANSPAAMMMAAMNQGATLEQVEKMMDLQDRWERKEAEKAYNAAFAAFKAEAVRVVKGRKVTDGPLRGKEYAELHDVVDAVTPALSRHGLSTSWKLTRDEKEWIEVTCTLKHIGGHSESVSMGGPPDAGGAKNALQARASTKSYLERYTLKAICGVAEGGEDNDGNPPPANVPLELLAPAREAAMQGWKSLSAHIKGLSPEQRAALEPESYALKKVAKTADEKGAQQ